MALKPLDRVDTSPLFLGLHEELIGLLRGLDPEAWGKHTVAGAWTVRDVVAHLIDGQMRRLSTQRDRHRLVPNRDLSSYRSLVAYLDELNASWVGAMTRVSPALLLDMLEVVGPQLADFVASLDPDAPAIFPVAWAGEAESRNWFDIGRDYTELWHHQAQIRLAVRAEPLEQPRWLSPVLALSVRALRRSLEAHPRPAETAVSLHIDGEAGGSWSAIAGPGGWTVYSGSAPEAAAHIVVSAPLAWRLFFNALDEAEARRTVRAEGDGELIEAALRLRSVMVSRSAGPY